MNSSRWVGILVGTIVLISSLILFGSTTDSAWYNLPLDAVNGIAFTLAFGLGLDPILAYLAALVTLVALFYLGYALGYKVHNKLKS